MARSARGKRGPKDIAGQKPAIVHWAARLEDRFHDFRERRARRRGTGAVIIPYTGYGGDGWVRVLGRVLLSRATTEGAPRYKGVRGWRSFLSIPVKRAKVTVTAGNNRHSVTADRGGVIDADVTAHLKPGWHKITLSMAGAETVSAPVFVSDPEEPIGIISDIDDTVMVTALPRPLLAAWNTFVLNEHARTAVPGMNVLYERLTQHYPGAPVVYLSTGAWNVAPTLNRFLTRNLYPSGALLLTDWGPTHDRMFRSGREHKKASLERLATEFPNVRWLLIGDDGQHDEEIYGDFALAHPALVAAVAIRQLSTSEAVLAGGRSKASDRVSTTSVPWVYAPDGAGLAQQLANLGLLPGGEPPIEPSPEQSAPPRPEPTS
jgi:phosphatidate phosphatase APP1